MSATINYEVRLLAMSFLTGVGLLVVYDCLRVFRLLCPHSDIAVGIEDMLYWIYSALMTFSLLYRENDGDIRAYAVVSAFVGMALYQWLVSRNFLKYLKKLLKYLRMKTGKHKTERQKKRNEKKSRKQRDKLKKRETSRHRKQTSIKEAGD